MNDNTRLSFIGTGALGTTLINALNELNYEIKSIYNRTESKAKALAEQVYVSISGSFPEQQDELGDVVFLTVPDSQVTEVSDKLVGLGDSRFWEKKKVLHCSGVLTTDALKTLGDKGASVGAMHPLQTFSNQSTSKDFRDIYFSFQGDEEAKKIVESMIRPLGAKYVELSKEGKPHIHAAAVMAANYFATLVETSGRVAHSGGVSYEDATKLFFPLLRTMFSNVENSSPKDALSGPLKRGDIETIQTHLDLMRWDEKNIYKELGRYTLEHLTDLKKKQPERYIELMNLLK